MDGQDKKITGWFITGFILLFIYAITQTIVNGYLMYGMISTREFDRGYNLAMKHAYEVKNRIKPQKLQINEGE